MRVLIVLADTDRSDASLCALDLHAGLASLGSEVRTVALGPGPTGGLDHVVPVLGPAPRSLAAVLQLRREHRWADVVVGFGAMVAKAQLRAGLGRDMPVVVVEAGQSAPGARPRRSAGAVFARATAVVSCDDVTAAAVGGLTTAPVTRLDFGVASQNLSDIAARRSAARLDLDLDDSGPVLWWVGAPMTTIPAALSMAAERRAWPILVSGDVEDELLVAASDVAVLSAEALTGPPRELMRAAGSGHALVAPVDVADGDLVSTRSGVPLPPAGRSDAPQGDVLGQRADQEPDWGTTLNRIADSAKRTEMARGAHLAVSRRFSPELTVPKWADLLERVLHR